MALRVAAVGEITEDLYLAATNANAVADVPAPLTHASLGGISVNFARSAAALGADATVFSAVGDDARGARLLATFPVRWAGVTLSGRTATQKIRLLDTGEREFCGFDPGVLVDYNPPAIRGFGVAHVPIQPETAALIERIDGPVVADFSLDSAADPAAACVPYLPRLRVAFIGGRVEHLASLRALASDTVIVLTCGPAGAYAITKGTAVHQPTLATRVVDTTGCGDAFAGAFTVTHFGGASLADALRAGAERAAFVAARIGA